MNVKLGLKYRYEEGKVNVNHNRFLGYTRDEEGKLVIVPEEAEIVKRIYREFLEGKNPLEIKRGLEADGIENGAHNKKWWDSNIVQILKNEKYIGDALLQKTITIDILEKTRIKNDGSQPQYYVEGSQEPIISKEVFALVQEEFRRRSNAISDIDTNKKRIYSNKYALSSICRCSKCGDVFRRIKWNNRGKKSTVWRCVTRVEGGPDACDASTIGEAELQNAVVAAFNELVTLEPETRKLTFESLKEAIEITSKDDIGKVVEQYNQKQLELVELAKRKEDYSSLQKEIEELRIKKDELLLQNGQSKVHEKELNEIELFLQKTPKKLEAYDEDLTRKYIDRVNIFDDHVTVMFKAGLETDVARSV